MVKSTLKEKKFLFVTGSSGREKLMAEIAKKLQSKHSVDAYFLSLGLGKTKEYLVSQGISPEKITTVVYDFKKRKPNIDFLRSKEDEYGFNFFDIWQITAPRRGKFIRMNYQSVLSWMEYVFRGIEALANEVKINYVFITGIAGFPYVIAYKVFRKKGAHILELINARMPRSFTFDDNLTTQWPLLVQNYKKIKKQKPSKEKMKPAQKFIDDFKKKPFKLDNVLRLRESFEDKVKRYMFYARTVYYRRSFPNLKPFLWYPLKDKVLKNSHIFEQPVKGEKYILYPLQVQPEASTSVRGKWYVNQATLIENLSKSVPCDYRIYVKEHRVNYSRRPSGFHLEIKKYPQVRLISPTADTIDLIKNSSLIVTVTGTAGWEAIMLQKPVLTLGDVFYNIFDEVVKVRNISELPMLIKKNLDKKINLEKTLQFITVVKESTFTGIAALPGGCQNRSLSKENISQLVKGIELYCDRMGF